MKKKEPKGTGKYVLTLRDQQDGGYVKNRRMTKEERKAHCSMMAKIRWAEKRRQQQQAEESSAA